MLNHTANNTSWIQEHPEACYSTEMVPRLWPAWLLDAELAQISVEYSRGNVSWAKSAPYIKTEQDIDFVIAEIIKRVTKLNLHEFFVCEFDSK